MKLTAIYHRYIIYTLLAVLTLGSVTHYYIFRHSIHRSTDDVLEEYRQQVVDYAERNDSLVSLQELEMQHSSLLCTHTESTLEPEQAVYDSLIYSPHQKEVVVYRVLAFDVKAGDRMYRVTICQPTLEEDNLISAVIISLVLLFVLFMVASFLVSSYYTHILWRPFYKLLFHLKRYKMEKRVVSTLPYSGIDEFDEMNEVVYHMMAQINSDYNSLKELTEDTSHELQTPLSILKAKLELLQQLNQDQEQSLEIIRSMQGAVDRLSHFNKALLLIAKINNDQFLDLVEVDLMEVMDEYLVACEDIWKNRRIVVRRAEAAHYVVRMNKMLADRLVMNVLSNALRYNLVGGELVLAVEEGELRVSNSYHHTLPEGDLFGRFVKSTHEQGSTGLGLTIVKDICQKSGLEVGLRITDTVFTVTIGRKAGYC